MKIGVSSYDFVRLIRQGEMTLFDAIAFAAETGFDFIEFTDLEAPEGQTVEEYAERVREHCRKAGIGVSAYAVWADFINSCGGDAGQEAERVKKCVDVAKLLGARLVRHDATWGFRTLTPGRRNWRDAIRLVAPAIRTVTEYARQQGIRTMCENHGTFMQDCRRMEELVLAVDHENFGLLVDMGNFLCADERCEESVCIVAPYAFHVHAKDFLLKPCTQPAPDDSWFSSRAGNHLRGTIVGHGVVPVRQCVENLRGAGYDGIVSLEFEGLEEPREAIRRGYAYLRQICG